MDLELHTLIDLLEEARDMLDTIMDDAHFDRWSHVDRLSGKLTDVINAADEAWADDPMHVLSSDTGVEV